MIAEIPHRVMRAMIDEALDVQISFDGKWAVRWRTDENGAWAVLHRDNLTEALDRLADVLRAH